MVSPGRSCVLLQESINLPQQLLGHRWRDLGRELQAFQSEQEMFCIQRDTQLDTLWMSTLNHVKHVNSKLGANTASRTSPELLEHWSQSHGIVFSSCALSMGRKVVSQEDAHRRVGKPMRARWSGRISVVALRRREGG